MELDAVNTATDNTSTTPAILDVVDNNDVTPSDNDVKKRKKEKKEKKKKQKEDVIDNDDEDEESDEKLTLKKNIGLVHGVAVIAGSMIGSGIFISPKGVLRGTGSVAASLCVWAGCGIISLLGSLCYAELGSMHRVAGGEYIYLMKAYGSLHRFFGPIQAYLFSWVSTLVMRPSAFAIISLAFAEYATEPFFDACEPPSYIKKMLACACMLTITLINCWSVRAAMVLQTFLTVAKVLALIIISIGGIVRLAQGHLINLAEGFEGTTNSPALFALAFYDGLWAYDGWNTLNIVTEELRNPKRNLPLAMVIAIPMVTLLYIFVNVSYFTVMSKEDLLASTAVAVLWGETVLGPMSWIIPLSVALSTFGACNGSTFGGSRVIFAAAREGHMLNILSAVHVRKFTPIASVVFNCLLAMLYTIAGDISSLIDFFSFTTWFFYALTFLSLIVMRFTMKDLPRPYKVPIPIPIICLVISIYLVFAPIVQNPQLEFLYAVLFILGGLIFYVPCVYFKKSLPGLDHVSRFLQMFLESAPAEHKD